MTFILTVLILGDFEKLQKKIWDYSWLVGTRRVIKRLQKTTVVYVKSQAVIMLLVAVVSSLWFWMMKSPYFLIQGLVLGALDALPLLGTGSFLYPAAFYYLLRDSRGWQPAAYFWMWRPALCGNFLSQGFGRKAWNITDCSHCVGISRVFPVRRLGRDPGVAVFFHGL